MALMVLITAVTVLIMAFMVLGKGGTMVVDVSSNIMAALDMVITLGRGIVSSLGRGIVSSLGRGIVIIFSLLDNILETLSPTGTLCGPRRMITA